MIDYKKDGLKRRIPTDEEVLAMISELMGYKPMTKEQIINRAIEYYYHGFIDKMLYSKERKMLMPQLLFKHHHRCYYCDRVVRHRDATIDHLLPLARGGTNDVSNYVIACLPCNNEKESMTEEEYREYRSYFVVKS